MQDLRRVQDLKWLSGKIDLGMPGSTGPEVERGGRGKRRSIGRMTRWRRRIGNAPPYNHGVRQPHGGGLSCWTTGNLGAEEIFSFDLGLFK